MKQNEKAVRGGIPNGFNQNLMLDGKSKGFDVFNHKTKRSVSQRVCQCGNEISRDSIIFNDARFCADCQQATTAIETQVLTTTRTPRKALKAFLCLICEKHFAPARMSHFSNTCKECVKAAQAKPEREKRRFLTLAISNMHKSLRGLLAL